MIPDPGNASDPPLAGGTLEDLVAACIEADGSGDPAAVEALLRARPDLEALAREQLSYLTGAGLLDREPEWIGRYRVIQLLGRGGMGAVYLAEQTEPIRRNVAVKLIKRGMDSGEVTSRFATERQALALMNHACIAKVLDAGATADGRPYFVMEHVPGVPVTDYCDARSFSAEDRLRVFLQVCDGVQHAHLKGIVHRDLKPSNVLVTEQDGTAIPKIIDFGIAKAVDERLGAGALATVHGMVLGTPEYMSPEQAGGDPLDVDLRTDVYSLGVVLYELLTGTLPFASDRLRTNYEQLRRILRSEDPKAPSRQVASDPGTATRSARARATTAAGLQRRLRGDLDWICLRALEKDRERRYATVNDLAADVRRHLQHEPVLAGPPSGIYRLQKFVQRNRLQVGAAVVVLLALLGGLATSLVFYRREAAARQAAETDFERALTAVASLLTNVAHERLSGVPHMESVRKQLVEDAALFCKQFLAERGNDPRARYQAASTRIILSRIALLTDAHGEALAAARSAIDELVRLEAESPDDVRYRWKLGLAHDQLGQVLSRAGSVRAARDAFQTAVAVSESLLADHPDSAAVRRDLAGSLHNLAALLRRIDPVAAMAAYRAALRESETLLAGGGEQDETRRLVAFHRLGLGGLLIANGGFDEAETELLAARTTLRGMDVEGGRGLEVREGLSDAAHKLAVLYHTTGRPAAAVESANEEIAVLQTLVRDHRRVPGYRASLATAYGHLAVFSSAKSVDEAAIAAFRAAAAELAELVNEFPESAGYRASLALQSGNLGRALMLVGKRAAIAEAEKSARRALDLLAELRAEHPEDLDVARSLAEARAQAASIAHAAGKRDAARTLWEQSAAEIAALLERQPDRLDLRTRSVDAAAELARLDLEAGSPERARERLIPARATATAVAAIADEPEAQHARASLERTHLVARALCGDLTAAEQADGLPALFAHDEVLGLMAAADVLHACWRTAGPGAAAAGSLADRAAALLRKAIASLDRELEQEPDALHPPVMRAGAQVMLAELSGARDGVAVDALLREALPVLRRAREELNHDPERSERLAAGHRLVAEACLARGEVDRAVAEAAELVADAGESPELLCAGARLLVACAVRAGSEPVRREATRGAVAALERSIGLGLEKPARRLADPAFDPVRTEPAFAALVARVR